MNISGQQLPTSVVDYRKEFSLDTVTVRKVNTQGIILAEQFTKFVAQYQENIDGIIRVYENIHRHTTNFHTNIFPRTVGLASSLYEYAQTAQVRFLCILPHECQSDTLLYFRYTTETFPLRSRNLFIPQGLSRKNRRDVSMSFSIVRLNQ